MTPPLALLVCALLATPAWAAGEPPEAFVRTPSAAEQARVRAEFGPGFRVLRTDHYRVISDASIRYHTVVAGVLEQFHQDVRPRFFEADIEPATFYLIDGALDYERFVTERGQGGHAKGYGMYDPRSHTLYARRYFPDGSESGVGTLFHEAMHAMLAAEFRGRAKLPAWVNEGFASLFERGRVVHGRWVYGNPNPWREAPFRLRLDAGEVPSLAELLVLPDAKVYGPTPERNLAYNSGRSLFLYVLRTHGEDALKAFLTSLRDGTTASDALPRATGLSLAEIEQGWRRSIREINFGGDYVHRGTGPDALAILQRGAAKHPEYGFLRLRLAQTHLARGENEPAIRHARAALEDQRLIYPQYAHSVIARAILRSDPREAARHLSQAISHQPWSEHILEGELDLLARMFEHVGDDARAKAVRDELARLRRLDGRAAR